MDRLPVGSVQQHIFLSMIETLLVARLDPQTEQSIGFLLRSAYLAREEATAAQADAETLLLDALGLRDWSPPEPLTYIRSAAAVAEAGRLDAQYYMPAKFDMLAALGRLRGAPVGASFQSVKEMVDPNKGNPATVVRNYNLTDALQPVLDAATEPMTFADIDSQKKRLRDGDLAVSRLRAYLKEIAVVRVTDEIPAIGSSEFFVLRKSVPSVVVSGEALMVYLKSSPVQTILKWCQDGSQHPRFAERDLMAIPLPDVVADLNDELTAMVRDALDQRARSLTLLEAAKRAVEIAIEDGETAALAYVAKQRTVEAPAT